MHYISQVLFFFGAIGAFNSLIISLYFMIVASYRNLRHRLFGWFLFVLTLRVLKSLFYAFSPKEPIAFLQSGPAFFLFIGPLLFTYVLSCATTRFWLFKHWKVHLLCWGIIVIILSVFVPFIDYVVVTKTIILPLINLQWLCYIIASGLILKVKRSQFYSLDFTWLTYLVLGIASLWTAFFFLPFDYFVLGSIIFSLIFYAFVLYFFNHKKTATTLFQKEKKTLKKVFTKEETRLVQQLEQLMEDQKMYINPDLKMPDLAEKLDISSHKLSQFLNDVIGESFTDFINKYRIEEAKQLMKTNSLYTIEAIGNQAGFKSKSAFYKAFKKLTATTPAKYGATLKE